MTIISKYVALKNYIPTGLPKEEDFEIKSKTLELDETNNIHVLNSWISVDPYMRARMTERKNYKPPFLLGEEMEGYAIGSVQKSKDSQFPYAVEKYSRCMLVELHWSSHRRRCGVRDVRGETRGRGALSV